MNVCRTCGGLSTYLLPLRAKLKAAGRKAVNDLQGIKPNIKERIKGKLDKKRPPSRRPDLTLLAEILLLITLAIILYYTWPYLTGSAKPGFSKAQFLRATKLPETAFNIEELAKVNLEVQSLQEYGKYFTSHPYSLKNSGVYDLFISVALLPLVMFFIQFVLPPFVIAYVLWFIVRFWPYVISALWGWFLAMYGYFTTLIQGKLGCKWYIRMVTGWGCHGANFSSYVKKWRNAYIDRPIYYEKLKYVKSYRDARKRYYEDPYQTYIERPAKKYSIIGEYAKKIYIDRTIEVFLKKIKKQEKAYIERPRDELLNAINSNKKRVAELKEEKAKEAPVKGNDQSVTPTGKPCTCPAGMVAAKPKKEMPTAGKGHGGPGPNHRKEITLLVLLVIIMISTLTVQRYSNFRIPSKYIIPTVAGITVLSSLIVALI